MTTARYENQAITMAGVVARAARFHVCGAPAGSWSILLSTTDPKPGRPRRTPVSTL